MPFDMIPGGRLPLTGGTLKLGLTRSLRLQNGTDGDYYFNYSTSGIGETGELVLHSTNPNGNFLNVLCMQNDAPQGYSAVNFRDYLGREHSALGYGNPSATSLGDTVYWESWSGSSIGAGYPDGRADFSATISNGGGGVGTILNVTAVAGGMLAVGQYIAGVGVTTGTYIVSLGTGTGGIGTYNVNNSLNIASSSMGAGRIPKKIQIVSSGWNTFLNGGLGGNTRETRIEFEEFGYIKVGAWAQHLTTAWSWDPNGHVSMIGNMTMTAGSLHLSTGGITLSTGGISISNGSLTVSVGNTTVQTLGVNSNLNMANGTALNWGSGRGAIRAPSDAAFAFSNQANNSGFVLDGNTADTATLKNKANNALGNFLAGSIGYATGAGGTVTQNTNKSTGVTLNKVTGQITTNNAALAAGAKVSFTLTNSTIAATDEVSVWIVSGGTANAYRASVTAVAAGSCAITLENITAGSLSEAPVIGFAVRKAVTA
jgi:hypothetical protein